MHKSVLLLGPYHEDMTVLAGLPETELHTHGIRSTSFRLLVTRLTERTRLQIVGWGRGDYQKEGRGVSGVSWRIHMFYIGHSQYCQLTAVKTG